MERLNTKCREFMMKLGGGGVFSSVGFPDRLFLKEKFPHFF